MSGYARPEENTLGVVIGKRGRPKPSAGSPAARALRQASAGGASLGTGYLGIGAGVVAGIAAVFGLAMFVSNLAVYPNPLPGAFAWLVYCLALATIGVTITILGERMPTWLFAVFLASLGIVIALDFLAIWPLGNIGASATASVAASYGLLIAVTLRRAAEILVAAGLIAVAFIVAILLTTPLDASTLPAQAVVLAAVILPPVFATWFVVQFRRIVQLELDRVLVQSTVSAPRFAVGMLASEELARLDLAAEELFESVSSGRTRLPLDPKTASIAASLATELRLHLIEGRRETWLYHAITESEQLGKSVTLSDAGSLAGLLDPQQRDGLLSAVWLLVSGKSKQRRTVQLTLGPVAASDVDSQTNSISVPIVLATTGISRSRVDPATWGSIARVGPFTNSTENSILRVEIDCLVANPADQYHAEQAAQR
ncbi:MAG TPA: hypothetical protein VFS93_01185 [Terrimesophilobacter sp.]|nr:hypothetical protein [Terrimesophilobacter sp.]